MAPRTSSRCVHIGDVFVLETRPADGIRPVGEIVDVLPDVEHESYRVRRRDDRDTTFHPDSADASIERGPMERADVQSTPEKVDEPDYEGPVLLHEP